jgi:hypothetical protein
MYFLSTVSKLSNISRSLRAILSLILSLLVRPAASDPVIHKAVLQLFLQFASVPLSKSSSQSSIDSDATLSVEFYVDLQTFLQSYQSEMGDSEAEFVVYRRLLEVVLASLAPVEWSASLTGV